MKRYYVLGNAQPNDRAVYFTNTESFHGGEYWGSIDEAYLFQDMAELCQHLMKHTEMRCFIVEVADVTMGRIRAGAAGDENFVGLYRKFNTVSYVLGSERR